MDHREGKARSMDFRALAKPQNLKLVLLGFLGIALILAGTFYTSRKEGTQSKDLSDVLLQSHAAAIETALEETVGAIRGAGKVQARVTLESGPENVYAHNVVRSSTSQTETLEGGTRESSTENETSQPVTGRFGSSESPLLEKILPARVAGCLIVAEGAASSEVKADIYRAVQALLGIPIYKIEVLPMKGGK
ncbi:MAG: hypothetical protein ACOX5M_01210 [Bacillota bacterium]|jgi:stage III sporulation protein AG